MSCWLSFVLEPHRLAKISPGIGVARRASESLLEFSDGCIDLAFFAERYAEADVGFDKGWVEAQRFAVRADGFGAAAGVEMRLSELGIESGRLFKGGKACDRSPIAARRRPLLLCASAKKGSKASASSRMRRASSN